jgi:hypothetical protein
MANDLRTSGAGVPFVPIAAIVLLATAQALPGAAMYSGSIGGIFNNIQYAGQYINQTAGAGANPPNFNFVARDNTATAVVTGNNSDKITWGSCNGCNLAAGVQPFSSIQWIPHAFVNQAPDQDFLLGTIVYTNGTINLSTGTYGADLTLSGVNVMDNMANAVALTPVTDSFTNWDTINLNSGKLGAVNGLGGGVVVNAAGKLFDNAGNPILDSLGNQINVPGPSYYDTFWSADYISFDQIAFANFTNGLNDAGTFEGKTATFDVFGRIVGDPQIQLDYMVLDAGAEGSGFAANAGEEVASAPEPASLLLAGTGLLAILAGRRVVARKVKAIG